MPTCHRHYPGRSGGVCSLVHSHRQRPSLCNSQVGSCNCCFGTCSAFTQVMACTLAESPSDPFHRGLRQLRCLCCRLDCYRVERTSSRTGVAPAEVQRLSRRTVTPTMQVTIWGIHRPLVALFGVGVFKSVYFLIVVVGIIGIARGTTPQSE